MLFTESIKYTLIYNKFASFWLHFFYVYLFQYKIYKIPRSREVKQSWITTVISTIYASLYSFPLVFQTKPEIVRTF